jgi:AcrR family transcriptional regulator
MGGAAVSRLSAENKELITAAVRKRGYESAVTLIRQDGWKNFTMDKLAAEMGVAKGTIYNYFKSKEDVVSFIIESKTRQIAADIHVMMGHESDTCRLLKLVVQMFLKHFREYRFLGTAIWEVAQKNSGDDEESFRRLSHLTEPLQRLYDVLESIFRRGMDEGVLRRADPVLSASLFHAMLSGIAMNGNFDRRLDTADEAVRNAACDAILRGFIKEDK